MSRIVPTAMPGGRFAIVAALAMLWLVINGASLTSYVQVTCDEGWYASTADHLLRTGQPGLPLLNNLFGLGDKHAAFGQLYIAALAGVFAVAGTGLAQARILSALGMVFTAAGAGLAGRRLYGPQAGWLAGALTAFAWDVYARGHLVRPEIWLAGAAAWLLLLYMWLHSQPSLVRGLVFGAVITVPLSLHPNGVYFVLAFGVVCLLAFGIRSQRFDVLAGAAAGVLAGIGLWVLLHLAPDVPASLAQWQKLGHTPEASTLLTMLSDFGRWMMAQYLRAYGLPTLLQASYLLTGIILALWKRDDADVTLLVYIGVSLLSYALLKVGKQPPPSVLWIPLALVLLAGQLEQVAAWLHSRFSLPAIVRDHGATLLALPLLAGYVAGDAWLAYRFAPVDYAREAAQVSAVVPAGEQLTADASWWLGVQQDGHPFLSDEYFRIVSAEYGRALERDDIATEFARVGVRYVILDNGLGCSTAPTLNYTVYAGYVRETCQPVATVVRAGYFGDEPSEVFVCGGGE